MQFDPAASAEVEKEHRLEMDMDDADDAADVDDVDDVNVNEKSGSRITVFSLAAEQPILIGGDDLDDDSDIGVSASAAPSPQTRTTTTRPAASLLPPATVVSTPATVSPAPPTLSPSLQSACELVQSILNQMTLKDAPPVNEHQHQHQQHPYQQHQQHQQQNVATSHAAPVPAVPTLPGNNNHNHSSNTSNNEPILLLESSTFSTSGTATAAKDDDDNVEDADPAVAAAAANSPTATTEGETASLHSPTTGAAAAGATPLQQEAEPGNKSLRVVCSTARTNNNGGVGDGGASSVASAAAGGGAASLASLFPEGHPVPLYQELYQQQPPNKLGHQALETLCHWTLQMLQQQQQQNSVPEPEIPRHIETQQQPQQSSLQRTSSSSSGIFVGSTATATTMTSSSNKGVSVLTPWRKKKIQQQQQTPMRLLPPPPQRTVRLQMFGSEYARHLSTSVLAPLPSQHNTNSNHSTVGDSPNYHQSGTTLTNPARKLSRRPPYGIKKSSSSVQPAVSAAVAMTNRNCISSHHGLPPASATPRPLNIEDATVAVQTGAILDILVTTNGQAPPPGYYRIARTASGQPFRLSANNNNNSKNGNSRSSSLSSSMMHLNVKKETSWDKAAQRPCITALTIIFPDRQEFVPPGFCLVRHGKISATSSNSSTNGSSHQNGSSHRKNGNNSSNHATTTTASEPPPNAGQPADIGGGTYGERVFLCFRRSREGNPITSIVPLSPSDNEDVPLGFTVVERTPRNFCANINPTTTSSSTNNNKAMFLAYRQRLANLETLRPLPLILSVLPTTRNNPDAVILSTPVAATPASKTTMASVSSSLSTTGLQAYYATGGTVVSSKVGRFHIMDRSTHSLLSPSSVANRLALIEKSRQESGKKSLPTSSIRGDDLQNNSYPTTPHSRHSFAGSFESLDDAMTATGGAASTSNSFLEHYNGATSSTTRLNTSMATAGGEDTSSQTSLDDEYGSLSSIFRIKSGRSTPGSTVGNNNGGGSVIVHGHSLFCLDQAEARRYVQAMSFIPMVQPAIRPDAIVALRLHARTTLITPILTACYNRHGGSALVAVEGLFALLKAGFFQDDVDLSSDDTNSNNNANTGGADDIDNNSIGSVNHDESSTRLTLLDLAIQVVCDVATTGAQETTFGACVEFVESAIRFSQAQLNTRTIGYVVRFYLFVFYFGASVPTSSTQQWPNPAWAGSSKASLPATTISSMSSMTDDLNHGDGVAKHGGGMGGADSEQMSPSTETFENSILFDPRSIHPSSTKAASVPSTYLPGGAPQSAALSFKELISLSIVRLGKISVNDILITCGTSSSILKGSLSDVGTAGGMGISPTSESLAGLLENLLSDVVDDAVDHVERANYTQLALHQIHRSGGSELFWHDMINACGAGLFGKDPRLTDAGRSIYIMIFAVMANLVKVSSDKIRGNGTVDLMPRDVASKLLALELLLHFLEYWSDEQEAVSGMELMASEQTARVVSVDTLAFTIRRMVVPCLLSNTKSGLEDPEVFKRVIKITTELWRSPICRSHCKAELGILIDHFALRLLEMGPQLIASTKINLWSDQAHISFRSQQMDLLKELKNMFLGDPKDSIEFYLNYDTNLASQTTGPTHLLPGSQWKLFSRMCAGLCGIAEQCGELIGRQIAEHRAKINSRPLADIHALTSDEGTHNSTTDKAAVRESARLLRTSSLEAISQIVRAIAISVGATKGPKFTSLFLSWAPVGSPIAYENLISSSRLVHNQSQSSEDGDDDDFDDVLRASENKPDRHKSGEENHALDVASELAKQKSVRKAVEYLIACNALTPAPRDIATYLRMHKTRFDPSSLGQYLGECGVGGAETEYWNSIRLSYVRAISFLGMNVDEALRHFLTNSGFRLPGEAQKIDRIIQTFAQCFFEDNAGDAQLCPFKNEDTVYLLCFAVIMLNTDIHKACQGSRRQRKKMSKVDFINNLRGIEQGEDIPRDYLSGIYDSIENSPIAMSDDESSSNIASTEDQHKNLQDMLNNTRSAESLLRGLAVHDFRFATIEDLAENLHMTPREALSKLTRSLVSETWHHWFSVISTCLETAHLDLQGMEPCVDILLYALSITVCLDMPTERTAFLGQLGRLKSFEELRQGRWVHAPDYESFRGEAWYLELEEACRGSDDRKIWALRNIREWMESVQEALLEDVRNKAELTKACAQLENGDTLLQDPARSFVRAGKLTKKSGRTGRNTEYQFVLFSDLLLYSKGDNANGGKYKIHEELPLHLTKVVDWFPSSQKNKQQTVFEIHHPRKSFQVVCRSTEERKSWVKDIREAILMEVERKMMLEAARLAVHSKA